MIFDSGGRFLRQDEVGRWVPVGWEMSRDKVSHSFQNQRRLAEKANEYLAKTKAGAGPNRMHEQCQNRRNEMQNEQNTCPLTFEMIV